MATSQHSPALRSLYRRLLRELPSKAQTTTTRGHSQFTTRSPLQTHIRNAFHPDSYASRALSTSNKSVETQLQEAEQYIQYVQAQRLYATLVERYNPGMNMNDEERVRLSARRVGMNLPVEFDVKGFSGQGKGSG
ncbi:hypothetical protein LTS18_002628 [Coniosporium uncinatum]|uniref:Uncharacterized protein n=1 Tax=Coniosporium uncinatum TaxID=93489 RepID=A0ACC3DUC8_9PEZI|nr:hypothetical protein LTS18_002628 [Coniosporium uncinatum]